MSPFFSQAESLTCDGVPLAAIAGEHGTPLYVYSAAAIESRYRAVTDAFGSYPHTIHYALKANSTLAIARLLRSLGSSVDANSGGEIDVALRAGFIPPQIVFTGVGKTAAELAQAIDLGVKTINAESEGELDRIDAIARERQTRARVAIRVNPDIDARSHPHISTGLKTNKFGVSIADARELCERMRDRAGLEIVGLHSHVGSQIMDLEPLRRAACALVTLAKELAADGLPIEHLDLGGGLGISYDGTPAPSAQDYAATVLPIVRDSGMPIVLEPGRRHRRARRRAAHARGRRQAAAGRQVLRHSRRGDDRADPADAVQRLPPHRAGRAAARPRHRGRRGRAAVREQRYAREGSTLSAASGRRSLRRARRRRVRLRHGLELQSPANAS